MASIGRTRVAVQIGTMDARAAPPYVAIAASVMLQGQRVLISLCQ